jgi:hypothetical protein
MWLRDCTRELVPSWIELAKKNEAQPRDFRLVGFIYATGIDGTEPNPEAADAWFRLAATERERARYRAALERLERRPRSGVCREVLDRAEHIDYDPTMFDEEIKEHLFTAVNSSADLLKLGLSAEQKSALAEYIIDTFEHLLSTPPETDAVCLPETPPERYAARPVQEALGRKENIREFLTRAYAKEIDAGIIEDADLSSLDRAAYNALHSWNAVHVSEPFHLVKKQTVIDREINRRLKAARQAVLQQMDNSPRQLRRQETVQPPQPR